jgi:antirestriction protein ArdC
VHDKDNPGETKDIPMIRYYKVFNAEQTEGIDYPKPPERDFNPIEEAEKILAGMPNRPAITHGEARAYYRPSEDRVNLPPQGSFTSDEAYYSTLFHELAHATGHASRLDRKEITEVNLFGSHDYSKEELVAEMGSAYLCGASGISPQTIDNQAAYIHGWLRKLRDDQKFVVLAAAKAQKAADYILNIRDR